MGSTAFVAAIALEVFPAAPYCHPPPPILDSSSNLDFRWDSSTSWIGGLSGELTPTLMEGQSLETMPSSSCDYGTDLFTIRTRDKSTKRCSGVGEGHLRAKQFLLSPMRCQFFSSWLSWSITCTRTLTPFFFFSFLLAQEVQFG